MPFKPLYLTGPCIYMALISYYSSPGSLSFCHGTLELLQLAAPSACVASMDLGVALPDFFENSLKIALSGLPSLSSLSNIALPHLPHPHHCHLPIPYTSFHFFSALV